MKLIKTGEHYVVVDDFESTIYATDPNKVWGDIKPLDISKVKKAIGEVDVEDMRNKAKIHFLLGDIPPTLRSVYLTGADFGFNFAISDNNKEFTEREVRAAIEMAKEGTIGYYAPDSPTFYFDKSENEIISALRRKEWEVEIDEDGNITIIQ